MASRFKYEAVGVNSCEQDLRASSQRMWGYTLCGQQRWVLKAESINLKHRQPIISSCVCICVRVCVGMCIVRVCARPNVMRVTRDGPDPAIWWLSLSCASMQYCQYFNRAQVWRLNGYGCCDSRHRAAFSGLLYFRSRLPRMRSSHIRVRREWLLNHYLNQFFPSELFFKGWEQV